MTIQWSGLSPELLLPLDRNSGQPLRTQLEGGLREAIRTGRLPVGERLPSSRELAREIGVSRGLVQECYAQLIAEGYLESRVGSATRVAPGLLGAAGLVGAVAGVGRAVPGSPGGAGPARAPWPAGAAASAGGAVAGGTGAGAAGTGGAAVGVRLIADFRSGVPDLAAFPRGDWVWAMREACREVATADLDYGDPRGSDVLRRVVAGYVRRVRAAAADPDRIVVCTGFAQGLGLSLRALAAACGVTRVAFEDPGYGQAGTSSSIRAAGLAGAVAVPVPVDADGLDVDALAASGARAVVVTPAHQSPTGVVLTARRRHALVEWAARNDAYIVEDDYDSEFRYDREPVGVLQGLAPDRVLTIGTVSKALVPAIRLGWVLVPPALVEAVAEEKTLSDRGTSGLDQLAVAALLESGRYDRHLRRMRAGYAKRREALIGALAQHAPGVRLTGLAAGFHAVAHLPSRADEAGVVAAARERSVGLYGMSLNRSDGSVRPPQLVIGFGHVGERAIEAGVAAVGDLLR
ncbi:MAG TPA: PLP-dependent aminotransferase family protein [Streptosporangiaceae bacterium]